MTEEAPSDRRPTAPQACPKHASRRGGRRRRQQRESVRCACVWSMTLDGQLRKQMVFGKRSS
jgi:hypothetical protein